MTFDRLVEGGCTLSGRPWAHHDGVSAAINAMSITVGGVTFDRVRYDVDADVLYLHVGNPSSAVEFDESPEGHALRFDTEGRLVGVTIVNARRILHNDAAITLTLPQPRWRLDASDLAEALQLAS